MFRNMKKRLVQELAVVFFLALSVRVIPAIFNWGWGNDFGIYYGLTKELVKNPQLFQPYTGWGKSYNYFPMLYLIIGFLHALTGLEIPALMRSVSPIIGSLSVVFFYMFLREMLQEDIRDRTRNIHILYEYLPLLGAGILAMNPFHAYQTAHAAPLTVGHMSMALSLWLFMARGKRPWSADLLYLSSLVLLLSHHLTTSIYIVFIAGIIFFRALLSERMYERFNTDMAYLVVFSTIAFAYWGLVATPVFYRFIPNAVGLPAPYLIGLFYLGSALIYLFFRYRWKNGKAHRPIILDSRKERVVAISVVLIIFAVVTGFTITDFGTGFRFLPAALVLLSPTFILLGFGIIGFNRSERFEFSFCPEGMLFSLGLVFLYSIVTWNPIIFPFRLVEYMAYPLAIYEAIGIIFIMASILGIERTDVRETRKSGIEKIIGFYRLLTSNTIKRDRRERAIAFTLFVASMILLSGATTYAVQRATSGYEESIPVEVADTIEYMKGNISLNSTVASDHRISTLLWEAGFNPTYDSTYFLWFSESWNDSRCLSELEGYGVDGTYYGPVQYIVIDSVMVRDGVQSNINETPRAIIPEFYEKFNNEPFELIYERVSEQKLMDDEEWEMAHNTTEYLDKYPYIGALSKDLPNAVNWCRLYAVNWTYINENMNSTGNESGTTRGYDMGDMNVPLWSDDLFADVVRKSLILPFDS